MNLISSDNLTEAKPQIKTAIEGVYTSLRTSIINGELEPGSRLRIEKLRVRFNVGSSTIREALSRLLAENLVTTEGQKGFRVAAVSMDDFREIVKMRALLETAAFMESIENGDDEWEGNLVAAHHRLAKIETALGTEEEGAVNDDAVRNWETRNREFHDALYSACDNRWLQKFRKMLYDQSVRYLRLSIQTRTIPRDVRAEHQAIFDAAINRDKKLGKRLLRKHIENSIDVLETRLPLGDFASALAGGGE